MMHCIYVGREATMPLTYHLRLSARARKLRVAIYTDGACIVTAPRRMPFEYVERFLKEKSTWLADKINFVRNNEWAEKLGVDGVDSHARTRQSKLAMRKEYTDLKAAAYTIAATRLKHFNTIYKLPIGKITIRNQKSRWGSCSRKGNLNFNYKIAKLPAHLSDYIVVHELCHIGQFNHSQKFWDLVAVALPEYRALRAELRTYKI